MTLNPFGHITSYSGMLNKIAVGHFFYVTIAIYLLNSHVAPFREFFEAVFATVLTVGKDVEIKGIEVPIGVIAVSFIWTLFSRIVKLHDIISDILKIRKIFELNYIIYPILKKVGFEIDEKKTKKLIEKRHNVMDEIFYEYASSDSKKSKIDRQAIDLALDQWSWSWILLEAIFVNVLIFIFCLFLGATVENLIYATAIFIVLACLSYRKSKGYAKWEVYLITKEEKWCREIRERVDALLS